MSTLKVDTWKTSSGLENFPCTAWVNFNGTGTVVIRDGGNVSSITDTGVGSYTVNLTTAMTNTNYNVVCGGSASDIIGAVTQCVTPRSLTTTTFALRADYNNGSYLDFANIFASVFGGR